MVAVDKEEQLKQEIEDCQDCDQTENLRCSYHQHKWDGFKDGQFDGYQKAKEELDAEEVQDEFKPTDDRGRVYLGSDHADKRVRVAILESEEK
ncbi:MAG: hypothetical protein ABEJ03_03185 [Candidatus Nanohaloarchaea archaeon]